MLFKNGVKHKEGLRFYVVGGRNVTYEVDLAENPPHGWCSCEDFEFRKMQVQGQTGQPVRCKHIAFVRELVVDGVIEAYTKQQEEAGSERFGAKARPDGGVQPDRDEVSARPPRMRTVRQETIRGSPSYRPPERRSRKDSGPEESYRLMQKLPQLGDEPP
jgi:hypothetical protein